MNYQEILNKGSQILRGINIKSSNLDCELILSKVLNKTREEILINLNKKIKNEQKDKFIFYLNKRKNKNPISHILGYKFFWKYKFFINKSALIPRPESEHIIEQALRYMPIGKAVKILDVGTGTGCLVISLLKERPKCLATALDISKEALKVAKFNAKLHQLENKIKFFNIDIDKFKSYNYDLIVSNPPYIKKNKISRLEEDVKNFEPKSALDGGFDGYSKIGKVIEKSSELLKRKGNLILEIGYDQVSYTSFLLKKFGFFINKISKDLSKRDRCIVSTKL